MKMASTRKDKHAGSKQAHQPVESRPRAVVGAIAILLIYQGYTLSIVGVASPWIAKSFNLDEVKLAELFAWMGMSALGSLLLARLADRFGRRMVILGSLLLAPLFTAGAALAPNARIFAGCEVVVSGLLGGAASFPILPLPPQ